MFWTLTHFSQFLFRLFRQRKHWVKFYYSVFNERRIIRRHIKRTSPSNKRRNIKLVFLKNAAVFFRRNMLFKFCWCPVSSWKKKKVEQKNKYRVSGVKVKLKAILIRVFFIRKSLFCLSLNFLNFSPNWAWNVVKFFLTFAEINWLEWFTLSLIIFYTRIWIPSLTFGMQ